MTSGGPLSQCFTIGLTFKDIIYPFSYTQFSQYTIMEFQSNFIPSCSILPCFFEFKSNEKLQVTWIRWKISSYQFNLTFVKFSESAKLLRQTKVCLKKLYTKFHSISICMNFDIFKGTLACLLTMLINISFTTSVIFILCQSKMCYLNDVFTCLGVLRWILYLGHQQFKLILNIR